MGWKDFAREAVVVVSDFSHRLAEGLKAWWSNRFSLAEMRRIQRTHLNLDDADGSVKSSVIEASLSHMEIARLEALCRKYNVPTPTQEEADPDDRFAVAPRHWYFDDDYRRAVLDLLNEARAKRSQEQRAWLLALTGVLGAITGLAAVILK